jgi:hypothetical protein
MIYKLVDNTQTITTMMAIPLPQLYRAMNDQSPLQPPQCTEVNSAPFNLGSQFDFLLNAFKSGNGLMLLIALAG